MKPRTYDMTFCVSKCKNKCERHYSQYEFDIQGLEVSGYSMTQAEYLLEDGIKENRDKINELVKAVNKMKEGKE